VENQAEFVQFLIEAKQHTYAAGGELAAPSRPGSNDLCYQRGAYSYQDTYLGDLDFAGEEAVWRKGKPIWSMNYYGVMLTERIPVEFSHCLKAALMKASAEAPMRGPARYDHGDLHYTCEWRGELERYEGTEKIFEGEAEIYELVFHGGRIRMFGEG
jgi:hypothetical protein